MFVVVAAIVTWLVSCGQGDAPDVSENEMGKSEMTRALPPSGIVLLGTRYSGCLKALYDEVASTYARPVSVAAIAGHVDNTVEIGPSQILIRLRPGSSEANVAHELLHPLLARENYPQVFSIRVLPVSGSLGNLIRSDLDHLVINNRLRDLGYDPHAGFLQAADSYAAFLRMRPPTGHNQMAVFQIGTIHELLKHHYYIADGSAEGAILQEHPEVSGYWNGLKRVIDALPSHPKPEDIWRVGEGLTASGDLICAASEASFRFSDMIGFEPVPLTPSDLRNRAGGVFEETRETLPGTRVLLRTFLRRSRMLVAVHIISEGVQVGPDMELLVPQFAARRDLKIFTVSP